MPPNHFLDQRQDASETLGSVTVAKDLHQHVKLVLESESNSHLNLLFPVRIIRLLVPFSVCDEDKDTRQTILRREDVFAQVTRIFCKYAMIGILIGSKIQTRLLEVRRTQTI